MKKAAWVIAGWALSACGKGTPANASLSWLKSKGL